MMLYLYAAKHSILKVYIWTSNSYKSYAQIIGYVINSQQNQSNGMGWQTSSGIHQRYFTVLFS